MPIYEYLCDDCGHEFDALQKLSDAPLRDCPACHKAELKKKISAPGFRLSGSGWYETDFKSANQKNLSQGDSSDKAASGKTEAKTENKADSKAEKPAGGTAKKEAVA